MTKDVADGTCATIASDETSIIADPLRSAATRVPTRPTASEEQIRAAAAAAAARSEDVHALTFPADAAGQRFDVALSRALPQFSRARLRTWIDAGRVTEDGRVATATRKVRGGEKVVVRAESLPRETASLPEAIALSIVAEDETLLVVDKPAGLVVHPGAGNWAGTLAERAAPSRAAARGRCRAPASSTGSTRTRAASWSSPRPSPLTRRSCGRCRRVP